MKYQQVSPSSQVFKIFPVFIKFGHLLLLWRIRVFCHDTAEHTAKPVPVMNTSIPCTQILTGKTCFNHWENLPSLQGSCSHCREPVFKTGGSLHAPCSTLYGIAVHKKPDLCDINFTYTIESKLWNVWMIREFLFYFISWFWAGYRRQDTSRSWQLRNYMVQPQCSVHGCACTRVPDTSKKTQS